MARRPHPQPRWRRRKDARPAEIVAAAVATFAERGFAAAKLDEIAARAGITRGTLYLYFKSKEDLFKAAVRELMVPALEKRAGAATPPASAAEALERFVTTVPRTMDNENVAAIPKLVIAEAHNFPDLARFYFKEVPSRARALIKDAIERGVASGEFRDVNVDHAFFCAVAPVFMALLWRNVFGRFDKSAPDLEKLCRTHLDILLHGLEGRRAP
ncbi:MAG: TetR/AcrR family transcriptional regulator [Gemmatimonas sp.]